MYFRKSLLKKKVSEPVCALRVEENEEFRRRKLHDFVNLYELIEQSPFSPLFDPKMSQQLRLLLKSNDFFTEASHLPGNELIEYINSIEKALIENVDFKVSELGKALLEHIHEIKEPLVRNSLFGTINLDLWISRLVCPYKESKPNLEFAISINNSTEPNLSKDVAFYYTRCNLQVLQSVLVNLISNAVKYASQKVVVSVEYDQASKELSFTVSDDGQALTDSVELSLRQRWIHGPKKGSGFGFASSHQLLLDTFPGNPGIAYAKDPKRFSFSLPAVQVCEHEVFNIVNEHDPIVILVEDTSFQRKIFLVTVLKKIDTPNYVLVSSAERAMSVLQKYKSRVAIILSDDHLGTSNGLQGRDLIVSPKLKELSPGLKRKLISGTPVTLSRRESIEQLEKADFGTMVERINEELKKLDKSSNLT